MKSSNPSNKKAKFSLLGVLAIGTGILALTENHASATLTYDLRATEISGDVSGLARVESPKFVSGVTANSVVTLDVWVQITTPTGAGVFGYQASVFDAFSSNGGSILGTFGVFTPISPWDISAVAGTPTDLDADGDLDLGTNTANTTNGSPKPRASAQLTTATNPGLFAPVNIPAIGESGFEFKVGTLTFRMTAPGIADPTIPIGLDTRSHTAIMAAGALKNGAALFTEGGTAKNGSTGVFRSGGAVQLTVIPVPEPSAFGMVLLGAMGLVGFRRMGLRRS